MLVSKTLKAIKKYKAKTFILGGGVAANKELRAQLTSAITNLERVAPSCPEQGVGQRESDNLREVEILIPEIKFTGDNAAMIGAAAYSHALRKEFVEDLSSLKAQGNLQLK